MKIEICEQMVQSWLLHHQQCQVVQTNWTVSPLRNIPDQAIEDAYELVNQVQNTLNGVLEAETRAALQTSVDEDYQRMAPEGGTEAVSAEDAKKSQAKMLNIIKKSTAGQFIRQCEIDAVGVRLDDGIVDRVFLVDSAFHKNGLGYHDVVATVIKKMIRATLVAIIIFGNAVDVTVAFAAPECRLPVERDIEKALNVLKGAIAGKYPQVNLELYFNKRFATEIYEPLKKATNALNNDNDLFMRALNLVQVAEGHLAKASASSGGASAAATTSSAVPAASSAANPPILFSPSDPDLFKSELLARKRAEITWVYSDGTKHVSIWKADNMTAGSNIKANLQGRPRWRTKERDGLAELRVKVL